MLISFMRNGITRCSRILLIFFCLLTCFACRKHAPLTHPSSILRISTEAEPQTLDPRRARDLSTITVLHMLYEGLMRSQEDGDPAPALAESVVISPDQKTYTFKLRKSAWSNGQPVTAYDFEQSWKSLLHPQFPSPNAYQLYVIEGAQTAKEGLSSPDKIGVYAKDENTLIVQLEQPTPYFLHLLATPWYYPVHESLRHIEGESPSLNDSQIVTNGPFKLEEWKRHNELTAIPNRYYWDHQHVHLEKVALIVLDNPTALELFKQGEIDWTGSPLSTLSVDALASLKQEDLLEVKPAAGVYLFRINTERFPLNHPKMRKAFALALNRTDLVKHVLQGNQTPAMGVIPPSFIEGKPFFQDNDLLHAKQLFQEALEELNLSIETFPSVTIYYASGERPHKIAQVAQQQWKQNLGVHVDLQSYESKVYYDHLKNRDYQLGIGSWFADIRDPLSFLEIFKSKENGTNNTQWEHSQYMALLDQSSQLTQAEERQRILKKAEQLLVQEMPIIPLFYSSYNYLKNQTVKDVYFSELGYLDFKNAYLKEN